MKRLINLLLILTLASFIIEGCEGKNNSNGYSIDSENDIYKTNNETVNSRSNNNNYDYYGENSSELNNAINEINQIIEEDIEDLLSITVNEMIRFYGKNNDTYDAISLGENKYLILPSEMEDNYFLMDVVENNNNKVYNLYDWEANEIAVMSGLNVSSLPQEPMNTLSARAKAILKCIQDHFDDICGDSFFTALACAAGCTGCPECCLGAAVIFGVGCAIDLQVSSSVASVKAQTAIDGFTSGL